MFLSQRFTNVQVESERLGHFLSLASELQLEGLTEREDGSATEEAAIPAPDPIRPETKEYSIEECDISQDLDQQPVEITAKVFQCDICGSKLSSGTSLRRHRGSVHQVTEVVKKDILCHILEQNQPGDVFSCDQCDHTTSSQKYLKQHLLVHEETKVHQCKFCEHSTKRAHDLKRHIEKKHPTRRASAVTG